MQQFQRVDMIFSSTDQPIEHEQIALDEDMKISNATDDKTEEGLKMNISCATSVIETISNQSTRTIGLRQSHQKQPLGIRDQNRPSVGNTNIDLSKLAHSCKQSIYKKTPQNSCTPSIVSSKKEILKPNISNFVSKHPIIVTKYLQTDEVQSIIFDSKAEERSEINSKPLQSLLKSCYVPDQSKISSFKQQIGKANKTINEGISNLQKMIEQLKRQKGMKQQVEQQKIFNKNKPKQALFESTIYDQQGPLQQKPLNKCSQDKSPSKVELKGSFHSKQAARSAQYTSFINRLSMQIRLDMEFTQKTSELASHNLLPAIRELVMSNLPDNSNVDASFFDIDYAEIDPLEQKPITLLQMGESQRREEANKLYSKYCEIQNHFRTKLHHAFPATTISLLLGELCSSTTKGQVGGITVGDLLSYLNMRTASSFRNRFFVKMMKRLGLKPNGCITATALQHFTTQHPY